MIAIARSFLDVAFASLWQATAIVALVAAVLLAAGRRVNATTRYLILECALVAVAVVPIATTLPFLGHANVMVGGAALPATAIADGVAGAVLQSRRIDIVLSDAAVATLAAAWLAGVFFFALRIAAGSFKFVRLRRAGRLFAHRERVPIFVSPEVTVPLAIGFVSPAIVVPPALAVSEASVELECALLHELAHLRRGDAWANACDRLLHAVLYFNPAVLVLVRWIALERETACDDIAVTQSRDVGVYVRSLAAMAIAAARVRQPSAFGMVGFARSTVVRIERLERSGRNGTTLVSPLTFGGFALMFVVFALAMQALAPAVAFSAPVPAAFTVAAVSCNADVSVLNPEQPDVPSGTRKVTKPVSAQVVVHVSASGSVTAVSIYKSSGVAALDRATLVAARKSTYRAARKNCTPVAGSYLFNAAFAPDGP